MNRAVKMFAFLAPLLSWLLFAPGGYTPPSTSTLKDQQSVPITLYSREEPIRGNGEMLSNPHPYEKLSAP